MNVCVQQLQHMLTNVLSMASIFCGEATIFVQSSVKIVRHTTLVFLTVLKRHARTGLFTARYPGIVKILKVSVLRDVTFILAQRDRCMTPYLNL